MVFAERHIGNDFSWRGAPQPDDIVKVSAQAAVEDIRAVGDSVAALYRNAAEKVGKPEYFAMDYFLIGDGFWIRIGVLRTARVKLENDHGIETVD